MSNTKLERITEMEKQLSALRAEVEAESKVKEWQPKGGDYTIWTNGNISKADSESTCSSFGMEYQIYDQAIKARAAMRAHNRLLAYVAEFDKGWEADWKDVDSAKYCVVLDGKRNIYCVTGMLNATKFLGIVYMSKECAEGLVEKLNKGIVKL